MEQMFCNQCEQTAHGSGCRGSQGTCGKSATTAALQDELTAALVDLARTTTGKKVLQTTTVCEELLLRGMFSCMTNVNFEEASLARQTAAINREIAARGGVAQPTDPAFIESNPNEDLRSLQSLVLFGMRGMAAYAYHALVLGYRDDAVSDFIYRGLAALSEEQSLDELLTLALEVGEANLVCMELLDRANTESFGTPMPTEVSFTIEAGPAIVISGHDLEVLHRLLEQTKDSGINVYTHGEMLPAHAYPQLKAYPHLKGNFGGAWQNQQHEFAEFPAAIVMTTNCIMPPKESYIDRIFTTDAVAYPGTTHLEDNDFSAVIAKARELGGFTEATTFPGINGGTHTTTGFGHDAVLASADVIVDAVKAGSIKHFFLVGGCDGARAGRSYFTDFVKQTPADTIILTLACGKYRFNDLDLGTIGGLPRLLDMGQCNDAYSAIKVAAALADAFDCSLNDLPLSMILSWYEQKAVCILLSLLYLGVRNIYLGPTLPAFLSPNVLDVLVKNYGISPTSTADADLRAILG
ncbi:MAG: hydroxylamine reductase [Raoultibacter sp.]